MASAQIDAPLKAEQNLQVQRSQWHGYNKQVSQQGEVRLLALMVEFHPDENRFTTGDGTFNPTYLDTTENIVLDPLPHDQNYFEAHLTFAKNYFEKQSDGQLELNFTVVPEVIRLDSMMAAYSPIGPDNTENFKLANLVRDSWEKADEDGALDAITVANYDGFIIFHAGAGRDFNFLGTTLDPTPQDIPSLYLNQSTLGDLLDDPGFQGFEIQNGAARITNAMILPETESRTGEILEDPFVLQLSINGLLTATIGNHLGLPDLFDTQEGNSAIGRFGLMDPEGFFAYSGLFPPNMSAWEKTYMGWANPVEITSDRAVDLPASELNQPNSIIKVKAHGDEYFLVENRHRDADNNGVTVTIQQPDGSVVTQTFQNQDRRFSATNVDSLVDILLPGVVTDVSDYDWALPGGQFPGDDQDFDTNDDLVLNGGVLIWHVDEQIIRSQIARGKGVNENPLHRGLDLEEADGAQDIGRATGDIFLSSVTGGTAYDFWWSGNDYTVITELGDSLRVYENRFGPETQPSNHSYDRQANGFVIENISDIQPTASAEIRFININRPYQIDTAWTNTKLSLFSDQNSWKGEESVYPVSLQSAGDQVLIPGEQLNIVTTGAFNSTLNVNQQNVATAGPLFYLQSRDETVLTAVDQQTDEIGFFRVDGRPEYIIAQNLTRVGSITLDRFHSIVPTNDANLFHITGTTYQYNALTQTLSENSDGRYLFAVDKDGVSAEVSNDGVLSAVLPNGTTTIDLPSEIDIINEHYLLYLAGFNSQYKAVLTGDKTYVIDLSSGTIEQMDDTGNVVIGFGRHSKNGNTSLVLAQQEAIIVYNESGAVLSNLYIESPKYHQFNYAPLSVDINGNGSLEIISGTVDSSGIQHIVAYDNTGKMISGFPLTIGSHDSTKPTIHPLWSDQYLYAATNNGDLIRLYFEESVEGVWKSIYGETSHPLTIENPGLQSIGLPLNIGPLDKSETYNWPNPATEETHLRFSTFYPADVKITVIDMTGRIVFEESVQSHGNGAQERLLNVSNWGSGVYYVRTEAKGDGKNESELYKMVVIQ
jgi:hypothetical protein